MQHNLRQSLGLLVDVPKFVTVTGINRELLSRSRLISEIIASAHGVDIEEFFSLCSETCELNISLFDWYPMSPTLHKILIHGPWARYYGASKIPNGCVL